MENRISLDFNTENEIRDGLSRVKELLDSNILITHSRELYARSVFIEILIHMKDLLVKADKYLEKRVNFTNDLNGPEVSSINDVTDLIAHFRDAACHADSWKRKYKSSTLSFNQIHGRGPGFRIGEIQISNEYEDDVLFIFGANGLYLKRHIQRAFNELEEIFKPHIKTYP